MLLSTRQQIPLENYLWSSALFAIQNHVKNCNTNSQPFGMRLYDADLLLQDTA